MSYTLAQIAESLKMQSVRMSTKTTSMARPCIAVKVTEGSEGQDYVDSLFAASELRGMGIITGSHED